MIRATVDANVIASGVFGLSRPPPPSPPAAVLRAWYEERFELAVADLIVEEVKRTLANAYFPPRLDPRVVAETLDDLRAVVTSPGVAVDVVGVATHPEDDLVLATAVSAAADYLVTGDRQLRKLGAYEGVTIVSPRDFRDVLDRRTDGRG